MTTVPKIHINGTSSKLLLRGYRRALLAVQQARDELKDVEFNARDYYIIDSDAWSTAVSERQLLFSELGHVETELTNICFGLMVQEVKDA